MTAWEGMESHQKAFRLVLILAGIITVLWMSGNTPKNYSLIKLLIFDVWAYFILWAFFSFVEYQDRKFLYEGNSFDTYKTVISRREKAYAYEQRQADIEYERDQKSKQRLEESDAKSEKDFRKRVKNDTRKIHVDNISKIVSDAIENHNKGKKTIKRRRRSRINNTDLF